MNIKYLFVFCLGAAAGSIFTARFLDERYSRIADEEIESVKEVAKKTVDELKKKVDDLSKPKSEKIPEEKIEKTLYHEIAKEYSEEPKDGLLEFIGEETFASDTDDFEKVSLWFYGIDKALVNDSDQPVDNADECVGKEFFDNPDEFFKDYSTVYLRNHNMGIDFEITYLDKSYSRDVLGLEE